MTLQRRLSTFVLLFLTLAGILPSLSASKAKYAGEFIAIGVGGRALGLGGAYAALANDVTAGYWNPAGLAKMLYPQVTLIHDERFAGLVNYDYGSAAFPVGTVSTLGFSIMRLSADNIPNTGSYTWAVPNQLSTKVRFKISDAPWVKADSSDGDNTIVAASGIIATPSPFNASSFARGGHPAEVRDAKGRVTDSRLRRALKSIGFLSP